LPQAGEGRNSTPNHSHLTTPHAEPFTYDALPSPLTRLGLAEKPGEVGDGCLSAASSGAARFFRQAEV
ncbi:MAG: hypothetical protein ACYC2R_14815, partial [Burkholderiales bacterium]